MHRSILYILIFCCAVTSHAQNAETLSFGEYIAMVKKYHPLVKQANLILSEGEAKLMKARGSFDPKLAVDYLSKNYNDKQYYDKLNAAFKIPIWYGIDFKAAYENNSGVFLNEESFVPENGLYAVGLSVDALQGLIVNKRMASLKQAKLYVKQSAADNELAVNQLLYEAALAYFNWLKAYQQKSLYQDFLTNAEIRFEGIKQSHYAGELPAIDTTEARIIVNNRLLAMEKASLYFTKATLELSNYLWINEVPVEVNENTIPDMEPSASVMNAFALDSIFDTDRLSAHPKLRSLDYKYQGLKIERNLQRNNLLPKLNLQYNLLSTTPDNFDSYNYDNNKFGLSFELPLFFRKERANLKLSKFKLDAIGYEQQAMNLALKNKIEASQQAIRSYRTQYATAKEMVDDYSRLLDGEENKFDAGESSVFYINYRESKLIDGMLKLIDIQNQMLIAKGDLFKAYGIVPKLN